MGAAQEMRKRIPSRGVVVLSRRQNNDGGQKEKPESTQQLGIAHPFKPKPKPHRVTVSSSIPDGRVWTDKARRGSGDFPKHRHDFSKEGERLLLGDEERFHRGVLWLESNLIVLLEEPLHGGLIP